MVEVTEIIEEEAAAATTTTTMTTTTLTASQERQLDADEIESLSKNNATRPSVKAHLESLVQRIRRDAKALKRIEDSQSRQSKLEQDDDGGEEEEEKVVVEEVPTASAPAPAVTPKPPQAATATTSSSSSSTLKYKPIDKFSFDAGSYNSPTVSIYITNLPNINKIPKSNIQCQFTKSSFDLQIHDYQNINYRLIKDNLDKDIDPTKSKILIKANKIIIKLAKVKSEYGSYDSWTDLTSKKTKDTKMKSKSGDPSASIMELMKDMYDSGDDNMKKMIGETMMKQREGKLGGDKDGGMDGMGMGGMGMGGM